MGSISSRPNCVNIGPLIYDAEPDRFRNNDKVETYFRTKGHWNKYYRLTWSKPLPHMTHFNVFNFLLIAWTLIPMLTTMNRSCKYYLLFWNAALHCSSMLHCYHFIYVLTIFLSYGAHHDHVGDTIQENNKENFFSIGWCSLEWVTRCLEWLFSTYCIIECNS